MKTADLIGPALDWAVCFADKQLAYLEIDHETTHPLVLGGVQAYGPSFIWSQGGPIIEQERIGIMAIETAWVAKHPFKTQDKFGTGLRTSGPTPLVRSHALLRGIEVGR
jgi:hypothetical protein